MFLNLFPTPQLPNIWSLLEIYPPGFYKVQSFELLQDKIQLYLSPEPPATQLSPVWSCFIYPAVWISLTGAVFWWCGVEEKGYDRMRTSWVVNSDPYPVFVQVGILDSIWELKKKKKNWGFSFCLRVTSFFCPQIILKKYFCKRQIWSL